MQRATGTGRLEAGEGRTVRLERTYEAAIKDVWDALTDPTRISRWFLPVSGDFRLGGRYQFEGNAGGKVVACDRPHRLLVTWEMGEGQPASEVELRLSPAGDDATTFVLEHTAIVPDEMWVSWPGRGRRGLGRGVLGLALHLRGGSITDRSPGRCPRKDGSGQRGPARRGASRMQPRARFRQRSPGRSRTPRPSTRRRPTRSPDPRAAPAQISPLAKHRGRVGDQMNKVGMTDEEPLTGVGEAAFRSTGASASDRVKGPRSVPATTSDRDQWGVGCARRGLGGGLVCRDLRPGGPVRVHRRRHENHAPRSPRLTSPRDAGGDPLGPVWEAAEQGSAARKGLYLMNEFTRSSWPRSRSAIASTRPTAIAASGPPHRGHAAAWRSHDRRCAACGAGSTSANPPDQPGLEREAPGVIIADMAVRVSSPVLIGRSAEVGRLRLALRAAAEGEGRSVLIAGEAGVGKTRLITEFADEATRGGVVVLLGGCVNLGEGAAPYAPFVEAIRGLVRELDDADVERIIGPARSELARLVPDLGPAEDDRASGLNIDLRRAACSSCCSVSCSGWPIAPRSCWWWRTCIGPTAPRAISSLSSCATCARPR